MTKKVWWQTFFFIGNHENEKQKQVNSDNKQRREKRNCDSIKQEEWERKKIVLNDKCSTKHKEQWKQFK